jgi:hypothetical protein
LSTKDGGGGGGRDLLYFLHFGYFKYFVRDFRDFGGFRDLGSFSGQRDDATRGSTTVMEHELLCKWWLCAAFVVF